MPARKPRPPEPPTSRRARLQGLRDAAADGAILTPEQLAFLASRTMAGVQQLRNGERIAQGLRAWRVDDGWRIATVDGARVVGRPMGGPD